MILNVVLLAVLVFGLIQEARGQRSYVWVRPEPPIFNRPDAPSPLHVWIGGEWAWQTNYYVWHQGYWAIPPAGKVWRAGSWYRTRKGWYWKPGRWTRYFRLKDPV